MQLGKGELAGAINGHKQVEPPFFRVHLSDVDMEVADPVSLELLLGGLVTSHLGQAADPVPLQATIQRGAGQVQDCGLEGVQAIWRPSSGLMP
jgi:hypothetical protein